MVQQATSGIKPLGSDTLNRFLCFFEHGRPDAVGRVGSDGGPYCERVKNVAGAIADHLSGKRRAGVYPLDFDGKCSWAVVEFEDHGESTKVDNPLEAARQFVEVCRQFSLSAFIERSKSRKHQSYHAWLFFDEPMMAALIRPLVQELVKRAGYPDVEIFPKNHLPDADPKKAPGGMVFLPYFPTLDNGGLGTPDGRTMFLADDGTTLGLVRFLNAVRTNGPTAVNDAADTLSVSPIADRTTRTGQATADPRGEIIDVQLAAQALTLLLPHRVDSYDPWLAVGMALHRLGDAGFGLWETWSRQSSKFVEGECAKKWATFDDDGLTKTTLGTLFHYAEEDSGINPAASWTITTGSGKATEEDDATADADTWPAPLDEAAFYGLAGEIVATIAPQSEGDEAALLMSTLLAFGSAAGRSAHAVVGATEHYANINVVLVGATSKGRKGTSWSPIELLMSNADPSWKERTASGLSSGEGLIWQVRNPITKIEPIREKGGKVTGYQDVTTDKGVDDKRLCVVETEFAVAMKALSRDGNTLSPVLRLAWDGGNLGTMTKNSPAKATGAHISVLAHISRGEFLRLADDSENVGGTVNRFCWGAVKRSKSLPEGGWLPPEVMQPLADKLADALNRARIIGTVWRDEEAKAMWANVYTELSDATNGPAGDATARAEAQVLRLSLIYALLDRSDVIRAEHLLAALACWDYFLASARWVFGAVVGHALTDELLAALKASPEGMTRMSIHEFFNRHKTRSEISAALAELARAGLAEKVPAESAGDRPVEKWQATPKARTPEVTSFTGKARAFLAEYRGGNDPTDPQKQTRKRADSTDSGKRATAPLSLYSKSSTIHNVDTTHYPNGSTLPNSSPRADDEERDVSQEAARLRVCSESAGDSGAAILDRAERFGWRTLIVGPPGPGQIVAGGYEASWRKWVAEHTNGERAAVLVALRSAVLE